MKLIPLLFVLVPTFVHAHEGVRVTNAWAPPSISQPNGVGFMTLNASGDDALVAVKSDCCKVVEMHSMTMTGDVMRMRRVDAIDLPDHEDVTLKSSGYHLMLIGLKEPLDAGDTIPLTLEFEHAKPMDIELEVKEKTVTAHEHMGHH